MPQDSSAEPDPDDSDAEFVEIDPTGRYGRYKEVLGRGAFKKVYRAFDEWEGIEVAWNQAKVADLLRNSEDLERLYSEVHLLKTLKHKNIIKFYNSWVDTKHENINFITEIFTSGTLRQYRKKHKHVDLRALKKWSRQILEGLLYLHSHDPPVIHRDLKCDNIFVNGNQGEVKIGDLGLAAILRQARSAHSVIGTPEFMAPELYEEEYNELVDIYAFGMCLLELVTFEYPYIECANAAQIYKKVTSGIKPASLAKVTDPGVRAFIEKCIAKVPDRLTAQELLKDPFLHRDEESESVGRSLHCKTHHSVGSSYHIKTSEDAMETSRDFTVQGQRKDINTIFLKLRIADSTGQFRNIHFPFDIEEDTTIAVASEMVEELDLTDQDVSAIAAIIESEIRSHIPDWVSKEISGDIPGGEVANCNGNACGTTDNASPAANETASPSVSLALERLPSGRKYWCDSPKTAGGNSPINPGPSNLASHTDLTTSDNELHFAASLKRLDVEDPRRNNTSTEEEEYAEPTDSSSGGTNNATAEDLHTETHSEPLESNYKTSKDNESENVEIIAGKLEFVLANQQKELDELKRKHELAISDLVKNLPSEIHQNVLNLCKLKLPDYMNLL